MMVEKMPIRSFKPEELANLAPAQKNKWKVAAEGVLEQLDGLSPEESVVGYFTGITESRNLLDANKQQSALSNQLKRMSDEKIHTGVRWVEGLDDTEPGFWVFFSREGEIKNLVDLPYKKD